MSSGQKALVLLVHGSRDPAWMEPFDELRKDLQGMSAETEVRIACLQFSGPDLAEAVAELAGEGVKYVRVVPVFVSGKGHVLKDVPEAVESAIERFPGLDITVTEALGEFPEVARAFREALKKLL